MSLDWIKCDGIREDQSPLQRVIDHNRALAKELGIRGTPGFIVGAELQLGALDLNGLKDLVARARKEK